MPQMIRITQLKIYPVSGDLQANHNQMMNILGDVADCKPDIVVSSECYLDGYISMESHVTKQNIMEYAIDPMNSVYTRDISKWSAENGSWFIYGCTRATQEGAYNTALIFNRAGKIIGMYDKVHCQTHDKKYVAGQSLPVFQSDFGLFGIMICADRRWPETVRTLALKGARVIFNPTFGMHCDLNRAMMRTRSYESNIFIVFTHPLESLITGPKGQIICDETREDISFAVNEIDLSEVDTMRTADYAHLKDRRPDVYEM